MNRKKKIWLIMGIPLILIFGFLILRTIPALIFMSAIPNPHSVDIDTVFANRLVTDFDNYGKFFQLDDCQRHQKYINKISVRMDSKLDSSKYIVVRDTNSVTGELYTLGDYPRYYKDVLKELDINEDTFEDFRSRLEKSKLRNYHKIDSVSIFIVDGFLDGLWGYFYKHGNDTVATDFQLGQYSIHVVEKIGPHWYRFGGS
jgi:hypothetical protein